MITAIFDYFTTLYFVKKLGIAAEANIVIRWLIANFDLVIGVLLGKVLQLVAVISFVGLHRRLGNLFLLVAILLNCWAVVINTI